MPTATAHSAPNGAVVHGRGPSRALQHADPPSSGVCESNSERSGVGSLGGAKGGLKLQWRWCAHACTCQCLLRLSAGNHRTRTSTKTVADGAFLTLPPTSRHERSSWNVLWCLLGCCRALWKHLFELLSDWASTCLATSPMHAEAAECGTKDCSRLVLERGLCSHESLQLHVHLRCLKTCQKLCTEVFVKVQWRAGTGKTIWQQEARDGLAARGPENVQFGQSAAITQK